MKLKRIWLDLPSPLAEIFLVEMNSRFHMPDTPLSVLKRELLEDQCKTDRDDDQEDSSGMSLCSWKLLRNRIFICRKLISVNICSYVLSNSIYYWSRIPILEQLSCESHINMKEIGVLALLCTLRDLNLVLLFWTQLNACSYKKDSTVNKDISAVFQS